MISTFFCFRRAFPSGEKVTYTGAEVVCSSCVSAPQRQTARASSAAPASPSPAPSPASPASHASPDTNHRGHDVRDLADNRNHNENGECTPRRRGSVAVALASPA